jgi:hypothetical protein
MCNGGQKEIYGIWVGWYNLSGAYILCTKDPIATSYSNPTNKPILNTAIITNKPTVYNFSKQFISSTMFTITNGIR